MGVEAARRARRMAPSIDIDALWFATVAPAYLDKTNATAVHAALRLPRASAAYDALGSVRSALGALRAGIEGNGTALVVAADIRGGLPGGTEEAGGGDGAAALLVGDGPVMAELVAWNTTTEEFVDRWRTPGDVRSKVWEERFGETRYTSLGVEAWEGALKDAGIDADEVDHLIVTSTHERAAGAVAKKLGLPADRVVDGLATGVGNTGAAHPVLLLASALERAAPRPDDRARRARRRRRCAHPAHDRRARDQQPDRRRPGRRGRADRVRQVPRVARPPAGRAAAPAGARAPVGLGRRPRDRLEVRIRRLGE